jgi:hypothetical protein
LDAAAIKGRHGGNEVWEVDDDLKFLVIAVLDLGASGCQLDALNVAICASYTHLAIRLLHVSHSGSSITIYMRPIYLNEMWAEPRPRRCWKGVSKARQINPVLEHDGSLSAIW